MLTGTAPGFVDAAGQNFGLIQGSAAIDAGTTLHPDALPSLNVVRQYVKHQSSVARPVSGSIDIGAFEFLAVAPVQITTATLPSARRMQWYEQTILASGGSGTFVWSVVAGSLPQGLRLESTTGRVYGRPRLRGEWAVTVRAEDAQNPTSFATRQFTIASRLFN